MLADWSDVPAAAIIAAEAIESVIVEPAPETGRDDLRAEFRLQTLSGARGTLTASRALTGPGEGVEITLTASIGPFGDPAMESALLGAMSNRLNQLRGVEYAPVR